MAITGKRVTIWTRTNNASPIVTSLHCVYLEWNRPRNLPDEYKIYRKTGRDSYTLIDTIASADITINSEGKIILWSL